LNDHAPYEALVLKDIQLLLPGGYVKNIVMGWFNPEPRNTDVYFK